MKNKIIKLSAVFLSVLILFSSLFISSASAAETVPEDIETSDVISDLTRMGIDYTKYQKDSSAEHCRMLKFLEFGFDYNGNQKEYGLYIYVWNPTGKEINSGSVLNKITIQSRSITNVEQSDWRKLPLEVVDYSDTEGYEHVFYKLRVRASGLSFLLKNVSRDLRVYEVSEIELHHTGNTNAESYTIGGRFTYTGFQPYHNSLRNAVNTLNCSATDRTVIEIDIHPTTWKTDTSAKGVGYANELFSVYFAVPNDIIRDYGNVDDDITKGLVQIDGMYDRHSINGLVVNDKERYDVIYNSLGVTVPNDAVSFTFYSNRLAATQGGYTSSGFENPYNIDFDDVDIMSKYYYILPNGARGGDEIKVLTSVLQADISDINDFVAASDLRTALYDIWNEKGLLYYDDYFNHVNSSSGAFQDNITYTVSSKDENGKYVDIADAIKVYAEGHKKPWWEFWHNSLYDEGSYDNIKSIQVIYPTTYNSELGVMTSEYVSDKYYVSERDIGNLGSFASNSALYDKTTYLMRFAVEDYYATEVDLSGSISGKAIYFEKVIYQNVDILTFTFENKYSEKVVLPVAATPVDNVGEITPTLKPNGSGITNSDNTGDGGPDWDNFKLVVLLIAGVLFIVLLNWLCNLLGFKLSSVFKVIFAIIAWPFKMIGKLFDFGDSVASSARKSEEHKWKRQDRKKKSNSNKSESNNDKEE